MNAGPSPAELADGVHAEHRIADVDGANAEQRRRDRADGAPARQVGAVRVVLNGTSVCLQSSRNIAAVDAEVAYRCCALILMTGPPLSAGLWRSSCLAA